VGSGVAYYRGSLEDGPGARDKTMVPTGVAAFPKEMTAVLSPRIMLERDFNLTHYTKMPKGGHFACFEQPQLLVADIRDFFRPLRG
jgi:pimeloyl-ACP methyl ester carboxylesterase